MAKKILITEDSPTVLNIMKEVLESAGYEVITAQDGQQALDAVHKNLPDLIVLDLMLPKMDGYKVCRFLKFDEKYREIPIIMLTARGQEEDKNLGQQMGADAYIIKSEKPEVLLEKIKQLIK